MISKNHAIVFGALLWMIGYGCRTLYMMARMWLGTIGAIVLFLKLLHKAGRCSWVKKEKKILIGRNMTIL